MFGYLLSVAVAFIVFGTVVNIVKNFSKVLNNLSEMSLWFGVTVFSVFWFITIPIAATLITLYLLKLLVDLISKQVLKLLNRNKPL